MILAYKIIEWLTYCRYNDSDRHLGSPSVNKMNWSALLGPTRYFTKENRVFILKNNLIIKFKKTLTITHYATNNQKEQETLNAFH